MKCPRCKADRWEAWQGRQTVLGVELDAHGERCANCGEIVMGAREVQRQEKAVATELAARGIGAGAELRWVRKAAGLRGGELARLLDVTPDTVSRWETGRVAIPAPVAFAVGELYTHPRRARARLESIASRRAS